MNKNISISKVHHVLMKSQFFFFFLFLLCLSQTKSLGARWTSAGYKAPWIWVTCYFYPIRSRSFRRAIQVYGTPQRGWRQKASGRSYGCPIMPPWVTGEGCWRDKRSLKHSELASRLWDEMLCVFLRQTQRRGVFTFTHDCCGVWFIGGTGSNLHQQFVVQVFSLNQCCHLFQWVSNVSSIFIGDN